MSKKTAAGTDVMEVKKQNQQSASKQQGQMMNTEFAEETNVQDVKKQNQQSEQNKQNATSK